MISSAARCVRGEPLLAVQTLRVTRASLPKPLPWRTGSGFDLLIAEAFTALRLSKLAHSHSTLRYGRCSILSLWSDYVGNHRRPPSGRRRPNRDRSSEAQHDSNLTHNYASEKELQAVLSDCGISEETIASHLKLLAQMGM